MCQSGYSSRPDHVLEGPVSAQDQQYLLNLVAAIEECLSRGAVSEAQFYIPYLRMASRGELHMGPF